MKLKDLQFIIHSDLFIINLDTNETYQFVHVLNSTFENFKDYEVVGIRSRAANDLVFTDSYLEVAITNKKALN